MAPMIDCLSKLFVGKKFVTHPPVKAVDGILKSHLLIGSSPVWGKQPEALKQYFFGTAQLAERKAQKLMHII